MEQRVPMVTLGVADLKRSRTFYEQLGWRGQTVEETVFYQAGGMAVVLWGRVDLAADAGVPDASSAGGFGGVALAHNVRSKAEVQRSLTLQSRRVPRSPSVPPTRSTAATPDTFGTRTATSGRSHGTPASILMKTVPSHCPTLTAMREHRLGAPASNRKCRSLICLGHPPETGISLHGGIWQARSPRQRGTLRRFAVSDLR